MNGCSCQTVAQAPLSILIADWLQQQISEREMIQVAIDFAFAFLLLLLLRLCESVILARTSSRREGF